MLKKIFTLSYAIFVISACTSIPLQKTDAEQKKIEQKSLSETQPTSTREIGLKNPIGFKLNTLPFCNAIVYVTRGEDEVGGVWDEYTVRICDLPSDFASESAWGKMIGSEKLTRGSLWIKYETPREWGTYHYRTPATRNDFDMVLEKGPGAFLDKRENIRDEDLPRVMQFIPQKMREEHMLGFFAFDNGSFEIFIIKNARRDIAERIAQEINNAMQRHRRRR